MKHSPLALTLLALAPAAAMAQSTTADSMINYGLTVHEAPGGNGNGIIDPGESAELDLTASFTNQNGIANFSPPLGTFGSGTIRGFGSGWLDLHVTGMTGYWDVDPSRGNGPQGIWDIAGRWGTPMNNGLDVVDIELGQFPPNPAVINTANPVFLWRGIWTPASYGLPPVVTFQLAPNPAAGMFHSSVELRLSSTLAAAAYVNAQFGFAQILSPAPGTLPMCALPLLWRRRRRAG